MEDNEVISDDGRKILGQLIPINSKPSSRILKYVKWPDAYLHAEEDSTTCVFVEEGHTALMFKEFNDMRIKEQFCDIKIIAGGVTFSAHRVVLAACSPYFKAMLQSGCIECQEGVIKISTIDADTMKSLLDFAYSSCICINKANCENLLTASNFLQMLHLRDATCKYMKMHMNDANCIGINSLTESLNCNSLKRDSTSYILRRFESVAKSDEFLSISSTKMIEIICQDLLCVTNEEVVFKAVLRWYKHNEEERTTDLPKVLTYVRLPLVSPYFLHDHILPVLRNKPHCMKFLIDAMWYQLMPSRKFQLHTRRTIQRFSFDKVEVMLTIGGETALLISKTAEIYRPVARLMHNFTSLPVPLTKHGFCIVGNNYMYLAGGEYADTAIASCVYRYDLSSDHWLEMPHMVTGRSQLTLTDVDGCLYAAAGWDGVKRTNIVERFDPSNETWSRVDSMKRSVTNAAAVSHGGKLYVISGEEKLPGNDEIRVTEYMQMYDPMNNTWTDMPPMINSSSGAAACVLNDYIYVAGGYHDRLISPTNVVERYDIKNKKWEKLAPMSVPRYKAAITVLIGKIYVTGGELEWHSSLGITEWRNARDYTIECYDPRTEEWSTVDRLRYGKSYMGYGAVTLPVRLIPTTNPDICMATSTIHNPVSSVANLNAE